MSQSFEVCDKTEYSRLVECNKRSEFVKMFSRK